jgi:uncharacterized membrane protein
VGKSWLTPPFCFAVLWGMDTKPTSMDRIKHAAKVALIPIGVVAALGSVLGIIFGLTIGTMEYFDLHSNFAVPVMMFWMAIVASIVVFVVVLADPDQPEVDEPEETVEK